MKNELINAIKSASEFYRNQTSRPGYKKIQNTFEMESFTQGMQLIQALEHTQDDLDAFNVLTDRLVNSKFSWDNYSLNSYLIDALQATSKLKCSQLHEVDWNCFTPNAAKKFQGVVYRGTSSAPEKVFEQGFMDYNPSSQIDDYLKPRNSDVGVSTSRSFSGAEGYTHVMSRQGKPRFVYTIIYLGEGGFDIIETAKARAINLKSIKNHGLSGSVEKDEINVVGLIPTEYIYCATEFLPNGKQKITYNPKFNDSSSVEEPKFLKDKKSIALFEKIKEFFSSCLSHIKTFIWALINRHTMDNYGNAYRNTEISRTPQMQEAEAVFAEIRERQNSYTHILPALDYDGEHISPKIDKIPRALLLPSISIGSTNELELELGNELSL
jgi:hypothetical protein